MGGGQRDDERCVLGGVLFEDDAQGDGTGGRAIGRGNRSGYIGRRISGRSLGFPIVRFHISNLTG